MERSNKLEEIVGYVEFVSSVIQSKVKELKSKAEQGVASSRYITEESERLVNLLDKYVILIARLKKEFNIDYSAETGWEREVVWELRSLDEEKRQQVIKFIREIKKETTQ